MANPIWPLGLPQRPRRSGYRESPGNRVQRTPMDAGPARTRVAFTSVAKPRRVSYEMSESQYEIFETFFEETIDGGALKFDWPDPRSGSHREARIVTEDEPYEAEPLGIDWVVSFDLELI